MNPIADRELTEWISRFDERSCNTYHLVEKMEQHQAIQNGCIQENEIQGKTNRTMINIIMGAGGTIITAVFSWLARLQGMW